MVQTILGARSNARCPWVPLRVLTWLLCAGCAAQSTTTHRDYDDTGRPSPSTQVQATIVGKEQARIDGALALVRAGDYAGGIAVLEEMERDPDLGDRWRQEVLVRLGELHGMPLNPRRNPQRAVAYLEKLLRRYPDGEHTKRAKELLETYGAQGGG